MFFGVSGKGVGGVAATAVAKKNASDARNITITSESVVESISLPETASV